MSFISQSQKFLYVAFVGAAAVFVVSPVQAQMPELYVTITDTTIAAGDTSAWMNVYLQNYQDTLAGFAIRIVLDRPDIMEFRTDQEDTVITTKYYQCTHWVGNTCTDSVPLDPPVVETTIVNLGVDFSQSVINNWDMYTARSLSPSRHDVRVIGIAEADYSPPYNIGLLPRPTIPGLLFQMKMRVYDSLPDVADSIVHFYIVDNLSETNFSDLHGNLIGTITNYNICDSSWCEDWDPIGLTCLTGWVNTPPDVYDSMKIDTLWRYWICKQWGQGSQGDSCLSWGNYSDPDSAANADSISLDSIPWTIWNEQTAFFAYGQMQVIDMSCICGDANGDFFANVGDPVYLIAYIFKGGPPPVYPQCADVNNDGDANVGDVVYMINWIFRGGLPPNCGY